MADKYKVTEKKRLQDQREKDDKSGIFSVESFHRMDSNSNPTLLKEEAEMTTLDARSTELPTL